jgi:hypothetical protein
VEGAGLDGGNTFVDQLRAAIDQPGFFGAELQRLARNLVVVGLVGLAEIGGIGKGRARPFASSRAARTGVETARESDADFFPLGQAFQNRTHGASNRSKWRMRLGARITNFALMGTRLMTSGGRIDYRTSRPRQRCSNR